MNDNMTPLSSPQQDYEALLDYLKRNRGFDFTGYKRTSLVRRISKRMQVLEIANTNDYIDYLEVHPDEFVHLFNTILINVTNFFRDPPTWKYLAEEIIPRFLPQRNNHETQLRIWSAGCASGEEPYSIAMLLAEAMGKENFISRVKIYATDVDEEALNKGRMATYTEKEVESIPEELLSRYFDRIGSSYTFTKDIRRSVIFGRHDIIQDAPISRIDLLVCRNLLMYFNADTQTRVLARLHYAMSDGGFLFLGKAEMLLTKTNIFYPVDLKWRVFSRVPRPSYRDRLLIMAQAGGEDAAGQLVNQVRLRDRIFESDPTAQIVVDPAGTLALANERARMVFGIALQDIGRPFRDLQLSYRPAELRSAIEQAVKDHTQVMLKRIEWFTKDNDVRHLDITVSPIPGDGQTDPMAVIINFADVSNQVRLQQQLEHSNQELETAMEELQSTNEELETTNEELQSTIEELETTNEELQSTNEELETMNEELQSTNEELETLNDELRIRTDNMNQVNSFLETIMTSLRGGVIVVDQENRILVWNKKSEDLWGLRQEEVLGHNLFNLDIGLPVVELKSHLKTIFANTNDHVVVNLSAVNRRGKPITCKVTITQLQNKDVGIHGSLLVMNDVTSAEG